ncbi:MAG TPA: glycosyltransferase [Oligoflexus sp.]|uniref:glycosyltransferase n=1 Tax=Oligoflexus sp. TaxID=1971216 RepID=UPI002D6A062D|nr:glycosyltransferase [Oligoflexus sp.]HYX35366.1 glycosyltransferase [Oligoflexus sp.]
MATEPKSLEIYIDGLDHGGAEHLLLSMLPTLKKSFPDLMIVTFRGDFPLTRKFEEYAQVKQESFLRIFRRLWQSESIAYVGLSKSIMLATLVSVLRWSCRLPKRRIYCHEHTSFHYFSGRTGGLKKFFDFFYKKLIIVCLNRQLISYIISTRSRKKELEVSVRCLTNTLLFPNSFSAETLAALLASRKSIKIHGDMGRRQFRMFTLSRLDPVKQLTWAIDAAHLVALKNPAWQVSLEICGKGPDLTRLSAHLESCRPLENLQVVFAGFVGSILDLLVRTDLFLFPSRVEGFPLSLTEAALSGIDCVATNCPHGPFDIAAHFPNVRLVDPPTRELFISEVVEHFETWKRRDENFQRPLAGQTWPSIEELTERLVKYFQNADRSSQASILDAASSPVS